MTNWHYNNFFEIFLFQLQKFYRVQFIDLQTNWKKVVHQILAKSFKNTVEKLSQVVNWKVVLLLKKESWASEDYSKRPWGSSYWSRYSAQRRSSLPGCSYKKQAFVDFGTLDASVAHRTLALIKHKFTQYFLPFSTVLSWVHF